MNKDVLNNYISWILNSIELDADGMPSEKCIDELNCIVKHIWTEGVIDTCGYAGIIEQAEMDAEAITFLDKEVEK